MAITDPLSKVNYYAPKRPEYLLGKGLLEPFNNHNAAVRKKMFNVHSDHRTDVLNGEIAYCDTGYSNEFGRYNSAVVVSDMNYEIIAKISKFAHSPEHDYILVLRNPTNNSYTIFHRKSYNYLTETNGYLYDNSYVDCKKVGDGIRQGDILRKTTSYDEFGNKRDGINLEGCFMNIAETCEDGIILSEAVRSKFDSQVFKPKRININTNNIPLNLYGEDNKYKVCPFVGEQVNNGILMSIRQKKKEEQYYAASQDRLRKIMTSDKSITIGSGTVVDCDIYCNNPELLFKDQKYAQLAMIYINQQRYSREIVNTLQPIIDNKKAKKSYDLEELYLYHKRILDGQQFLSEKDSPFSFVVMDFTVYDISRIQIGDKITNRDGGKGVVAGFLPEELMPLLDNGRHVEAIWNSAGIVGRLNPGQLLEMESNFISARIIERMRSGLYDMNYCYDMYFNFLSFVCPQQCSYIMTRVDEMSISEKKEYFNSIIEYPCIHFTIEPISESYGIDLLNSMYEFFDWIKPYTVMIQQKTSTGEYRLIPTRRTLIAGHIYYYRLKQHAEEKFSTTSLSATNIRGQNTRSRSSKIYESPFSRTPVQMGSMEAGTLEHINPELVITMLLLHSASTHGRRLAKKLLTDDPYDVDIKPDNDTININAQIAHVYLKAMGLKLIFKKTKINMVHPAWLIPCINTKENIANMYNQIYPAYFMTEKEKELQENCLIPAHIRDKTPAEFVPANIIERGYEND